MTCLNRATSRPTAPRSSPKSAGRSLANVMDFSAGLEMMGWNAPLKWFDGAHHERGGEQSAHPEHVEGRERTGAARRDRHPGESRSPREALWGTSRSYGSTGLTMSGAESSPLTLSVSKGVSGRGARVETVPLLWFDGAHHERAGGGSQRRRCVSPLTQACRRA